MGGDVVIRPLRAEDHAAWLPLWQGYQRFYRVSIDERTSAVAWQRMLDPEEPMHGALALDGADGEARAVGMVHFIYHRSTWTVGDYCYLQDLYVDADVRGRGIGRSLIEHVADAAKQAGASRVYWLTHETNRDAMQLYDKVAERSGFVQYRRIFRDRA